MLCNEVENYIAGAKGTPFFYSVGDDTYTEVLSELKQRGIIVDRASDFCMRDDKYPNLDDMIDYFRTLDVDFNTNRHVLIGLGEYLALRGTAFAEKELGRLKSTTLGTARVILLLRSVTPQVNDMVHEDNRLAAQQRVFIAPNAFTTVSLSRIKYSLGDGIANGVKGLLHLLEDGATGTCSVNTNMEFSDSIYPVSSINTAYEALQKRLSDFDVPEEFGTEQQWDQLFQELSKKKTLDAIYSKYKILEDDIEDSLYQNCTGLEFRNWLFFIYLKRNINGISNEYLKYVVSKTEIYDLLKYNILTEIVRIPRANSRFEKFYWDRKKVIGSFPASELAIFIHENKVDPDESIFRFTDSTELEREEIIKWIAKNGYIKEIGKIYPALGQYLKDYVFDCGSLSEMLTQYFKQYRLQKVENRISPEFLHQVLSNSQSLLYTHLETRDNVILRIEEKQTAFLYWIDALGVEYLAYITELAKKKGLAMNVDIAYTDLPTITSINKGFYDKWPGSLKAKEEELDDIKHKVKGGYNFEKCDAPIHLASELKVIERAVDRAATELSMHTCKTFVIASDHGASRLAVINRQEEKYGTDTKGEHSGRCCEEFEGYDMPYAVQENGYLVLADYGRFNGSRAANVEVHGGATLEEVVVPIITLKLKNQSDLVITVEKPDTITADRNNGTEFIIYISDVENSANISVVIGDKRYNATSIDSTHYSISMPDVKRAKKKISASIYDGDDRIGNVEFDVKGKIASVDSEFDDLF